MLEQKTIPSPTWQTLLLAPYPNTPLNNPYLKCFSQGPNSAMFSTTSPLPSTTPALAHTVATGHRAIRNHWGKNLTLTRSLRKIWPPFYPKSGHSSEALTHSHGSASASLTHPSSYAGTENHPFPHLANSATGSLSQTHLSTTLTSNLFHKGQTLPLFPQPRLCLPQPSAGTHCGKWPQSNKKSLEKKGFLRNI